MLDIDGALSQHKAGMRRTIEQAALDEVLDVEMCLGLDEEERTIWTDYIISNKDHEIALVEEEYEVVRRSLYEMIDEDKLLSESCDALPHDIILLDRVSYLPEEVFVRGHTWQKR